MTYVGMTFRDLRAQLTLHVWLNFGRHLSFLSYARAAGLLVQIPNPRNRKAAFTFRTASSFHRLLLNNFLHAHVTCSDSESEESKGCFFSVRTASSSNRGLFLHAHLSMNFTQKPNDLCRATNRDDILTAAGIQPLFKSRNGLIPNSAVEYDTVLNF